MYCYWIKDEVTTDITNFITTLTIEGEYRSCTRNAVFGLIQSPTDENIPTLSIDAGDQIIVEESETQVFHGVVWSKTKGTDGNQIDFTVYDYGIYLKQNKGSYSFKSLTPKQIVTQICSDFSIETGDVADVDVSISRTFIGHSLYDMLMTAYTLASDEKYYCYFDGNKLNVAQKGEILVESIESKVNLLTTAVTESLGDMVNGVSVYNSENELIDTVTNVEDQEKYGILATILRITDTKEDYLTMANNTLQGITQKITVTNFGDVTYTTGKRVYVVEPYTNLIGEFYIDGDTHYWKNGLYTNSLVLNFQNIMDEKESGSSE